MADESSSASYLSVAMTTTGMTQNTGGNTVVPSSPRGIEFYLQCAVLVIGIVGTVQNVMIIYALVASKQHKKQVLIFHQNVLDFACSFFVVIVYSVKLSNISFSGSVGYWLCVLTINENLAWYPSSCGVINLAMITIERYLKVVHPVWSTNNLRKWMIYTAMAIPMIAIFITDVAVLIPTNTVIDGVCYVYVLWPSNTHKLIYLLWNVIIYYVVIIIIFIYCYWRILLVIRRQAKVMAGSSSAQAQSNKTRNNVVKTMIIVSAFYAILWFPGYTCLFVTTVNPHAIPLLESFYYTGAFLGYSYMIINPFIYAISFGPVKQVLLEMIPCKKSSVQVIESGPTANTGGRGNNWPASRIVDET